MSPALPPLSTETPTPWNWVRKNLLSDWLNSILTIVCLIGIALALRSFFIWATTEAQWQVLKDNLTLFLAGRFPAESLWRLWAIISFLAGVGGLTWGRLQHPERLWNPFTLAIFGSVATLIVLGPIALTDRLLLVGQLLLITLGYWLGHRLHSRLDRGLSTAWIASFPIIFWLIGGGFGLKEIPTANWSGLLLTVFTAAICLVLSFPLGVLLALSRRSELPVVRWFATLYRAYLTS